MAVEKTKSSTKAKAKKKEPIALDENILMLSRELYKHISDINMEINQHQNRKSIIISEKDLNEFLRVNVKLAQIKDIKEVKVNVLDNDILEIVLDIEKFSSKANLAKEVKIENCNINDSEASFNFSFVDTYNTKGNDLTVKIIHLISKYIIRQVLTPELQKKLTDDNLTSNNDSIKIDYKEGSFKLFYDKTINEIFNTNFPFFGHRKIMEMIEIESIMCEKGQIWVDFIYKIS